MARLLTKSMADLTTAPFSGTPTIISDPYSMDSGHCLYTSWWYQMGTQTELYIGSFFTVTATTVYSLIDFWDSLGNRVGYLSYNSVTGLISLYSGDYYGTHALAATGTIPISINTPYHLQIHFVGGTSVVTKIDDVQDISYSGSIGGNWATIGQYSGGYGPTYWDSLLINNVTDPGDGTNMSWTGVRRLKIQTPTSDGTYTDWSKSNGAVAAYTLIDNKPPNASEYIYSQTNGQNESFGLSAHGLPTLASVKNVVEQFYALKNTDGQIKIGARISTNNYLSSALDVGVSGNIYQYVMAKNPATGLDWVQADLNSVQPVIQSVI